MGFMDKIGGALDPAGIFGEGDSTFKGLTGESAAEAAMSSSQLAAQGKTDQLNYLKEINKLPQQYRDAALKELSEFSANKGPGQQQEMIDMARESPIYNAIMGSRESGEEAILRNAGMTGGLRSGNVQSNLFDANVQLENKALATSFAQLKEDENRRLGITQGLAGLNTGTSEIGGVMSDIGKTNAMGLSGAAQAEQSGAQNMAGIGMGVASLFI